MASYSVGIGSLLVLVGLWGYFGAEEAQRSFTALIPAMVGMLLIILGAMAFKEELRKHVMHAAAAVGLLGFLAAAGRLVTAVIGGKDVTDRGPLALLMMAILCGVFTGLCVKSFIDARRAREKTPM